MQDNQISWLDWENADKSLLEFTQKLISLRKNHYSFSRRKWFQGHKVKAAGLNDIAWFLPEGEEMSDDNWSHDFARSLGVYLNGHEMSAVDENGNKIIDDSFYIIFNAHHGNLDYVLPPEKYAKTWEKVLDTSENCISENGVCFHAAETINVAANSVIILKNKTE